MLTVAANEEDDEIDAGQYSQRCHASVRVDAVVHHHVPIFTCQYLQRARAISNVNSAAPIIPR